MPYRAEMNWVQRFILLFAAIMMGSVPVVIRIGSRFSNLLEENRTETLQNRAVQCRNLAVGGYTFKTGDPCLNTVVLRYYDPNEHSKAVDARSEISTIHRLDCRLVGLHGRNDPDCTASETSP